MYFRFHDCLLAFASSPWGKERGMIPITALSYKPSIRVDIGPEIPPHDTSEGLLTPSLKALLDVLRIKSVSANQFLYYPQKLCISLWISRPFKMGTTVKIVSHTDWRNSDQNG
jgi:hypothetical protein